MERCASIFYRYNGTLNVSYTGKDCVRWDSLGLQWMIPAKFLPVGNYSYAENHCLDVLNQGPLRCFTERGGELDYCSLPGRTMMIQTEIPIHLNICLYNNKK